MDVEKVRLKRMLGLTADILALAWVKPDVCSCRIDVPGLCPSCAEREATLTMIRDASRMTEEEEAAYAEPLGEAGRHRPDVGRRGAGLAGHAGRVERST